MDAKEQEFVSPREIDMIRYRDSRTAIAFHLINGDVIEGSIRWFDRDAVRLVLADRSELTLFFHAVAYYQART